MISGSGRPGGPIGAGLFMKPGSYKTSIRPKAASPDDAPLASRLASKAALAPRPQATVSLVAEEVRSGLSRPFTFQWRQHGKALKGETRDSVTVPVSPSMSYGEYSCTVLDAERADVSSAFRVRVVAPVVDGDAETKPGVFSDSAYRASRGTAKGVPVKGAVQVLGVRVVTAVGGGSFWRVCALVGRRGNEQLLPVHNATATQFCATRALPSPRLRA